jgi:transmembrane sensor
LVLVGMRWLGPRNLSYEVRGSAHIDEHSIAAVGGERAEVRFSDGSTYQLFPGTKLQVGASTPDGSSLSLQRGELLASVVHRASTHWSVTAGPFEVVVVGTRFGARWDVERQRVSVELHEGAVEVKGGGLAAPIVVHAGQRLEAGVARDDWKLTALAPTSATSAAPALLGESARPAEPAPASSPTQSPEPLESPPALNGAGAAAATSATPTPASSWSTLMSHSDFRGIVQEAKTLGVERCFNSCTPANLRILADAARYTGEPALAEKSLLALRGRSPAQAAAAGFFLGRLYESGGRAGEALKMYDRYLAEAPHGDYADEAHAGKARLLQRAAKGAVTPR